VKLLWSAALIASLGLVGCGKGGDEVQRKSAVAQAFGEGMDPAAAPTCDAGALRLDPPAVDEKTGVLTFTVTNTGPAACGMYGTPTINFGAVNHTAPIKVQHTADKPKRVVLGAKTGTAKFVITYLAGSGSCLKPSPTTVTFNGQVDKKFEVTPAPKICGDGIHITPVTGKVAN
jgi:hypothetical protein